MFKSIRWTLQLWHAGILFLALASFGTVLYVAAQRTAYTEVDNELAGAARVFVGPGVQRLGPSSPNHFERPQLAIASQGSAGDSAQLASDVAPPTVEFPHPADAGQTIPAWLKEVPQDCLRRLGWDQADQPYFIVWGSDGSVIRQSSQCPAVPRAGVAATLNASSTLHSSPLEFRQRGDLREVLASGPAGSTVLVGRSIRREEASLANLRWSLLGAGAMVMAIGLLGGGALSRRVLHPIHLISEAARSISASDLSRRIDRQETKSELGSLVQTLNDAFDRLESAFHRQAQFTADASHELRTPLSVIHASSELALKKMRTPDEYRQTIESNLRASKRMNSLVESLLVLARADADALELKYSRFDLRQAADDCATLLRPVATKRNVRIEVEGVGIEIAADRDRILQLITNLINNAIQYNREGGGVRVLIVRDHDYATLKVVDTGIGIPRQDQARIFERFFRVDPARGRESGGCGLGLAICKSIASAHGGDISFGSVQGVGTAFMVRLPIGNLDDALNRCDHGRDLEKRSA
ncbi:MAG TPA: ATP-binding protein [Tepidisphaeraceae bacterium]|nr:ATP-binding protein [Tepidisphaeraceae bacterium]